MKNMPPPRIPPDPVTIVATLHGNLVHLGRENAAGSIQGRGLPGVTSSSKYPNMEPDTVEDFIALHEDSFADLFGMEIYHEIKRKLNYLSVRNGEARARVRLRVELEE